MKILTAEIDARGEDPTAVPPQISQLVGRLVAKRYQLEEIVGSGPLGVVFRGRDAQSNEGVAVKFALPGLDTGELQRFRREATIGTLLDHPNCMKVHSIGETESQLSYMVMPFVEGQPMQRFVTGRVEPELAARWAMQLFQALAHAHAHGVVHCDIRPENIFVVEQSDGSVRIQLTNFGLSTSVVDRQADVESTSVNMQLLMYGTPTYMAPEALSSRTDERSDIYSAGLVVWWLVVGALPFEGQDDFENIRSRATSVLPNLPPFVPAPLAAIIQRMLQGESSRRYSNAKEIIEDLDAFSRGAVPPHAHRDPPGPPPEAGWSGSLPRPEMSQPLQSSSFPEVTAAIVDHDEDFGSRRHVWRNAVVAIGLGTLGLTVAGMFSGAALSEATPSQPSASGVLPQGEPADASFTTRDREGAKPSLEQSASRLTELIDFADLFTDDERTAAVQLIHASRLDDPCASFEQGLRFVEENPASRVAEVLDRAAPPENAECHDLAVRLAELKHIERAPFEPARRASIEEEKPVKAERSSRKPRSGGGENKPVAVEPLKTESPKAAPANSQLPAAPRLDEGLRRPSGL